MFPEKYVTRINEALGAAEACRVSAGWLKQRTDDLSKATRAIVLRFPEVGEEDARDRSFRAQVEVFEGVLERACADVKRREGFTLGDAALPVAVGVGGVALGVGIGYAIWGRR